MIIYVIMLKKYYACEVIREKSTLKCFSQKINMKKCSVIFFKLSYVRNKGDFQTFLGQYHLGVERV